MRTVFGGQPAVTREEVIARAERELIEGMGHNLPPGLRARIAHRIADFVWRVEGRRSS